MYYFYDIIIKYSNNKKKGHMSSKISWFFRTLNDKGDSIKYKKNELSMQKIAYSIYKKSFLKIYLEKLVLKLKKKKKKYKVK